MTVTASELRADIYNLLGRVIKTGIELEVNYKGKKLKIIPEKKKSKWDNLKKHLGSNCDPEELVHMDWSKEWKWEE